MSKKFLTLTILALFLAAGAAYAQLVPTAKMEGKVLDAQGAPLPGVSVEATSPKLVGKATAVTDAEGMFRLFSLPSGTYEITFTLQGFKTLIRRDIVVQLSQTIVLNVNLEQTTLEEQVTVIGQSPLIDVKSTVKGQTMTKEVFMALPRNRSFDGLLSTVPGVQYDNRTGGLSVDGATGTENMWYMDGADITQPHVGTNAQGAVMELVDEVKVTAAGYNAEFGGSMGGVINVITRSGGNAFHGDVSAYYEDNSKFMQGAAREYFRWDPTDNTKPQYVNDDALYWNNGQNRDDWKRFEGVFSLGGYILKDRLWFFGSFNPVYSRTYAQRFFNSDAGTDPNNPNPLPKYPFYQKWLTFNGSLKLTAAPLKGLRVSASLVNNFSKYRGAIPDIKGGSTKNYAYGNQGFDYPNFSTAFVADYSASNNFLVSLRGGYHMTNTQNQQIANRFTTVAFDVENFMFGPAGSNDPFFQAHPELLNYAGAVNYGGSRSVLDRYKLEKYSGNADLSYYMSLGGEHAWKAGFQIIRDQENVLNGPVSPMVNIAWDQNCTQFIPYDNVQEGHRGFYGYYMIRGSWRQPYGYAWNIHRNTYAMYLQDSWTINGKLTINAGLRTESEYIPTFNPNVEAKYKKPIQFGFGDKLAPRLGVVYDVFGDSSLKVFGSFGIYYDVMKLYMAEGAFGGFKWQTDYYTLDNPDWTQIAASGRLDDQAGQAAGGTYIGTIDYRLPSFDFLQPDMKPVAQREISIGAEKKLTEDLSVRLNLTQKHLIRTIEDIGFISVAEGGELYYSANPGSAYIQDALHKQQELNADGTPNGLKYWPEPSAKREYYGANITIEKRFSHNWQGGVNYTMSLTKGNYGGLSSTDEFGRNSPNVERSFDFWFMMYQMDGTPINGRLPQDRTHYFKAYGSYSFPIGLTVGAVAYGRSGNPISTQLGFNNAYIYPNGYGDLGNLPFTFWMDVYAEWAIKIQGKYTLAINAQLNNATNTKTFQQARYSPTRWTMSIPDANILNGDAVNPDSPWYWKENLQDFFPDVSFRGTTTDTVHKGLNNQFGTWTARLGLRFSF